MLYMTVALLIALFVFIGIISINISENDRIIFEAEQEQEFLRKAGVQ